MSVAYNYLRFLFSLVAPFQHGDILEIGSGRGNITEMTLKYNVSKIRSMTCIEPDANCINALTKMTEKYRVEISILEGFFPEVISGNDNFDLIYSFNVMEHIEDDQDALITSADLLKPGGVLFAFVPAFPILYGSMDRMLRHFRRYTKKDIRDKFLKSGLKITELRYFNFMGFWGWFINNRILNIKEQKNSQVKLFDKLLPLQVKFERHFEPFVGQNLLIIGKKW